MAYKRELNNKEQEIEKIKSSLETLKNSDLPKL